MLQLLITDAEAELLNEALADLREVKVGYAASAQLQGVPTRERPFTAVDFGVPAIDTLINKLHNAEEI